MQGNAMPMNEHSMSSYVWLNSKLDMAVLGPESVEGSLLTRAEWVRSGASDMLRGGVGEVNGITPIMKLVHLAEAFGMRMEVHDGNAANMHVLCAMGINGRYYERGMVHPMLDHETPPPWHKPGNPVRGKPPKQPIPGRKESPHVYRQK
mgnify:CR=1 FL=1